MPRCARRYFLRRLLFRQYEAGGSPALKAHSAWVSVCSHGLILFYFWGGRGQGFEPVYLAKPRKDGFARSGGYPPTPPQARPSGRQAAGLQPGRLRTGCVSTPQSSTPPGFPLLLRRPSAAPPPPLRRPRSGCSAVFLSHFVPFFPIFAPCCPPVAVVRLFFVDFVGINTDKLAMGIKDPASRIDGDILVCFAGIVQVGGLNWINYGAPPNGFHWLKRVSEFSWEKIQTVCGAPQAMVSFHFDEIYEIWTLQAFSPWSSDPIPCGVQSAFWQESESLLPMIFENYSQGTPVEHPYHYGYGQVTFLTPL